jgi:hypothetical protein
MEDKMIMIGVGARPQGEPMSEDLGMAEEADAEMFEAMAPRGNFTSRGLDPLVRSTNRMLPLFDQSGDYPNVEDTEVLPTDFVRILAMFQAAVEDAISEDVLREEMRIDLDGVIDDTGLMTIAGKLDMLSKDREFKKFLKEPMDDEVAGEEEMGMQMEDEAMTEDEIERMMMARM